MKTLKPWNISNTPHATHAAPSSTNSQLIGGIVGGVIGGALLVAIFVLATTLFLMMNNKRKDNLSAAGELLNMQWEGLNSTYICTYGC